MSTFDRSKYRLGPSFAWAESVRAPAKLGYEDDAKIVVLTLPTGERAEIDSRAPWRSACPLAWSPDGTTIFQSFEGQVDAIDIASGRRRTLTAFTGQAKGGVVWQLHCSPDGQRLLFLKREEHGMRIVSAATAGNRVHDVCAVEGVWNFACSWKHDVLLVSVSRPKPKLLLMDLEGQRARCILDGSLVSDLQIAADGTHAIYQLQSAIWSLDLNTCEARRIVEPAKSAAMSPRGDAIAFTRSEHDVHVQHLGGRAELVIEGCDNDDTWRPFGWHTQPIWSTDARLLFFQTTLGKRHAEPLHPDFVAVMRKKKADAQRSQAKGANTSRDSEFDRAIERDRWSFAHTVGIVDFGTNAVWMETGRWQSVAWAPTPR